MKLADRYLQGDAILVWYNCHVCHDCVLARPLHQEWRDGHCYVKMLVCNTCEMLLDVSNHYVPLEHYTGAH